MLGTTVVCSCRFMRRSSAWIFLLFLVSACQKHVVPDAHTEDTTWLYHRTPHGKMLPEDPPLHPPSPTREITERLDDQLQSFLDKRYEKGYVPAYTIQLHAGTDRKEVMGMAILLREDEQIQEQSLRARVVYDQPRYKLQVGVFYDPLVAHEVLTHFAPTYPLGMVAPIQAPLPTKADEESVVPGAED